jgi:hypothetical protein
MALPLALLSHANTDAPLARRSAFWSKKKIQIFGWTVVA